MDRKYWAWNNYTIMNKSFPEHREKYINLETENNLNTNSDIQNKAFFDNKTELLRDTKRVHTSLNERMPILQKGNNPFLGNNYLDHLDTEQEFLRAKSSNNEFE